MRSLFIAFILLSGCAFESEPELTCSWIPDGGNGIPLCHCSGRPLSSVAEAKSVCCAAEDAPAGLCAETP